MLADVRYCIDGEGTPWCCVVDVDDVG